MFAADTKSFVSDMPAPIGADFSRVVSIDAARRRRKARFLAVANAPLASLTDVGLERAFHAWHGASGRRYTFAVTLTDAFDVAALSDAVVVVASRGPEGRRALFIGLGRDIPASLTRSGASTEVHYHLLATTPAAREALIADLLGEA